MRVIDTKSSAPVNPGTGGGSGGAGFKKGGFKSSFTTVKGPVAAAVSVKKNVLGDDDDDDNDGHDNGGSAEADRSQGKPLNDPKSQEGTAESDTEGEYADDITSGGYYNPRKPTDCFQRCAGSSIPPRTQSAAT